MKNTPLLPDDPRLTAYALGELEPDDQRVVEAALRANPALRQTVDELRAAAQQLEAALQAEAAAAPELEGARPLNGATVHPDTLAPEPASTRATPEATPDPYPRGARRGTLLRFPQFYYLVGGAAAAGMALMVALNRDEYARREEARAEQLRVAFQQRAEGESRLIEVPLAPLPAADATVAGTAETAAASVAMPSIAPTDLSLLRQVSTPRARSSEPVTLERFQVGSAPRLATSSPPGSVPLGQVTASAGQVGAVTVGGSLAYVPGTRRLDAPAIPGGLDLYPGPRRRPEEPGSPPAAPVHNTETYSFIRDNAFLRARQNPLSTFALDVDTASYANVRRFLQARQLPPPDAVRIEELLNYFNYRYTSPQGDAAFAASLEVAEAPWAPTHRLVRIGLKGREVAAEARPSANLVFLLDVSGSMNQPNKLPLVKESLRLLLGKLRADDRVAIVTYAGTSGLALPSTPVAQSREILGALDALAAGGSTNGARGIQLAYDIAKANFMPEGVNRVILCTDGDFNVGVTSPGDLVRLVEEKAKSNVFLTVLGFGMGNLKDATLEQLADKGNGHYGYIDSRREAEKLFVHQLSSTLVTIAKDVKLQVEFNPAKVASYRLIGYENRVLAKEDFDDDRVDAGEVGSGHTVTALYEIVPTGTADAAATNGNEAGEDFRYQAKPLAPQVPADVAGELLTVKLRYKEPTGDRSRKLEFPLTDAGTRFAAASPDFRFAAAVAEFGMLLRKSEHKGAATMRDVLYWAESAAEALGDDPHGYRREFLDVARQAQELLKSE